MIHRYCVQCIMDYSSCVCYWDTVVCSVMEQPLYICIPSMHKIYYQSIIPINVSISGKGIPNEHFSSNRAPILNESFIPEGADAVSQFEENSGRLTISSPF